MLRDHDASDRRYAAPLDPAVAVSGLLTRLSLFLLVVFAPFLAMFSRRTVAIIVPIATVMLIFAAALDGHLGPALNRFFKAMRRPQAIGIAALVVWAAATLLWTPRPGEAAARILQIVAVLLLFAAAVSCLRDRTRRSDVNLIPIGTAIAAITLAAEFLPRLQLTRFIGLDPGDIESHRAAMLLVLLIWPALASLIVQDRTWQATALALVVSTALWLVHDLVVIAAFVAGALAFGLATWRPRVGTLWIGGAIMLLLLLAPLIGWTMARYGGFLLPRAGDDLVSIWRDVTFSLPSHLVQGFGFDASGALERGTSQVLLGSPRNAALEIWLELGLVGVIIAAAALLLALPAIEQVDPKARPAALAVFAAAGVMMFSGLAAWQSWWLIDLGLTTITLAFVSRRGSRRRE